MKKLLLLLMTLPMLACGGVENDVDQSELSQRLCDQKCEVGEVCVLEEVNCIRAPCPPLPVCVPAECDLECPRGQHCELEEVVCVRAPCPPLPACVPN